MRRVRRFVLLNASHFLLAALTLLTNATPASSATVWDESVDGDISGDGASPTRLTVAVGENAWTGQVGLAGGAEADTDLVTFAVPDGLSLTSLRLDRYEESPDIGGGSFLAIASGTTVDTGFGSVHLSNALVDATGEWLDDLAAGPQFGLPSAEVTGLASPLPPGDYVVWLGELSTQIDYTLVATLAVPEPTGVAVLGGLVLAGLAARRRS